MSDMVHSIEDLDDAARKAAFESLTEDERWLLLFEITISHNAQIETIASNQHQLNNCIGDLGRKIDVFEKKAGQPVSRVPAFVWVGLAGIGAVIGGALGQTGWIP